MNRLKTKKIIALDLDGTLLNSNGRVSDKTKFYLRKLKEMGYVIVIATGRILRSAIQVTDGAEFANYIVGDAGGLVYDISNDKVLFKNVISKETADKICSLYNDDVDYVEMCDLTYYYKFTNKNYPENEFSRIIKNKDEFLDNAEIIHMAIRADNCVDKMYDCLQTGFDDVRAFIMQDSFKSTRWIEISGNGVNKYNALKIISELENVANEDIIAFGDSANDLDMLKYCGIGVAMGNALEFVKAASNYVTKSHDDDGIVCFLEKYLENTN